MKKDTTYDIAVKRTRRILKDRRNELNMTQTELASAIGLKQPVISRLETDRSSKINLGTLHKAAQILGLSVVLDLVPENRAELLMEEMDGSVRNTRNSG